MEKLNSVNKGDASEAAVIAELKKRGYTVLQPFGDNQRYDIVVEDDGFERIQIKTARKVEEGKISFDTSNNHSNMSGVKRKTYTENEIDSFIAYFQERQDFQIRPVPVEDVSGYNQIVP